MKTILVPLARALLVAGTLLGAGCAGPQKAADSEQGQILQDAERYAFHLREQNLLPGFTATDHGRIIAMAPWHGGNVSYPVSVTLRGWREGDEASYRYQVAKDSRDAPWRLVSATRLDKQGKVVEQLHSK